LRWAYRDYSDVASIVTQEASELGAPWIVVLAGAVIGLVIDETQEVSASGHDAPQGSYFP
jgi:hypothetical protein